MNDDDEITGFKFYRIAYDHDRTGWCVYQQTPDNDLIFNCGPFNNESEAKEMMDYLHKLQRTPI